MKYLDRNKLPVFQERLDLSAEDLNTSLEIICTAMNELAGRLQIIKMLEPIESRSTLADDSYYPILTKLSDLEISINSLTTAIASINTGREAEINNLQSQITDLESRLNALDDATARKDSLAVLMARTAE